MPTNKLNLRRIAKYALALPVLALVFWITGVHQVITRLAQFPLSSFALIIALLGCNLWLVGFRFWRVLEHFFIRISLSEASRASLAGHVAGLMLISLVGQVAGRQAILRRFGVTPLLNASLAAYERVVLLVVSGSLALAGATYLLDDKMLNEFFHSTPLLEIVVLAIAGWGFSLWSGGTPQEEGWINRILTWRNLSRALSIFALSLAGQILILLCFVVGVTALHGDLPILSVLAAAALISFAASLPITVNGWGVRELTAVFVLGKLGVSSADAVAISILIGLSSTAVILATAPMLMRKKTVSPAMEYAPANTSALSLTSSQDLEKAAAWILGTAVASTIFFQFHMTLSAGALNLNLADPFALLSLAAMGASYAIMRQPIQWRVAQFNRTLLAITSLLILAFINGWTKIGITQWALGGRLLGWLVLVGYLAAGYILVSHGGNRWLRRLVETLMAVAVLIILWQMLSRMLVTFGMDTDAILTPNFEGYSGNRNAFSFQLLVLAAMLPVLSHRTINSSKQSRNRSLRISLMLGVVIAGIIWSGSRAGFLAGSMLLLGLLVWRGVESKLIIRSIAFAGLLWCAQWGIQELITSDISHQWLENIGINGAAARSQVIMQSVLSSESSNQERWQTWLHAFEIWRDSPIIGVGLGVFLAKSAQWLGHPQVIHSTPIWLLTEFGLVGIAVLGWYCRGLAIYIFGKKLSTATPHRAALALLFIAFAVFSLFHEIFYQRMFWFALGALLATPAAAFQTKK